MAAHAVLKHDKFMNKTMVVPSEYVAGLDYPVNIPGQGELTLREAIMSIRSSSDPTRNLFAAVDESYNQQQVNFAYKTALDEEARPMVVGLPLYLEYVLGPRIWNW